MLLSHIFQQRQIKSSQFQTVLLESVEQNTHYKHGGEAHIHNVEVLPGFTGTSHQDIALPHAIWLISKM